MDELDLDELLCSGAPTPSGEASRTAVLLARETRPRHTTEPTPRRTHRRRHLVFAAAAVVVVLTGATTVTAYQLGIPPFQTLDEGTQRSTTGIPVVYVNSLDRTVECLAFIEYRNLTADQRGDIERIAGSDQWTGYGQRVLDGLDIPRASPEDQNLAITNVVGQDLWHAAHAAVPAMVYMQNSDGPVYTGWSFSCTNPGGVDGRP